METGETIDSQTAEEQTPHTCPHVNICKFSLESLCPPIKEGTLDEVRDGLRREAGLAAQPPDRRGRLAEARAIEHNRIKRDDGRGTLVSSADVGRKWRCETCKREREVDQLLRDEDGNIIGLVEVKAGSNLRFKQGRYHSVIAQQVGIRYYKKVQHKNAIKDCDEHGLPYFDMRGTPEPTPL